MRTRKGRPSQGGASTDTRPGTARFRRTRARVRPDLRGQGGGREPMRCRRPRFIPARSSEWNAQDASENPPRAHPALRAAWLGQARRDAGRGALRFPTRCDD